MKKKGVRSEMTYRLGAAVLVGGRSRRMGRPKESVVIEGDGRTFLEKICDEVDACINDHICLRYLSVRKGQKTGRDGYVSIEDKYDDIGPLGGIISVLERAGEDGLDAVLFLACDMIRYNSEEITSVCSRYKGEDILWARTDGTDIQPLASIYSTGIVKNLRNMADKGDYKLRDLEKYVKHTGFYDSNDAGLYMNVNSL